MTTCLRISIVDYPGALQSAVHGLKEIFLFANNIMAEEESELTFSVCIVQPDHLASSTHNGQVVILPPSAEGDYYLQPHSSLLQYLHQAHQEGAILCSACAGAFLLARAGVLDGRVVTTHWQFADKFRAAFPHTTLESESLLINGGDIISAGGLMSWVDLGPEIVAQYAKPHIMRKLGKFLIVDTGKREQRYYESFLPKFDHGNKAILQVQHHIQAHYHQPMTIPLLASQACMSDRTFLRQFTQATTLKPTQYLQRVRVQKACELLETTTQSFEHIALSVGYEDANSFRKVFLKVIGLCPSAFRARFV